MPLILYILETGGDIEGVNMTFKNLLSALLFRDLFHLSYSHSFLHFLETIHITVDFMILGKVTKHQDLVLKIAGISKKDIAIKVFFSRHDSDPRDSRTNANCL